MIIRTSIKGFYYEAVGYINGEPAISAYSETSSHEASNEVKRMYIEMEKFKETGEEMYLPYPDQPSIFQQDQNNQQ